MRPIFFVLLSLLLLAAPARAQSAEPRPHLVWLEPASTVAGLVVNLDDPGPSYDALVTESRFLALSGGYARALTGGRSISYEAFVADYRQGCGLPEGCGNGTTIVRASVGLLHSFGGAAHRGFFLQPKFILGYTREQTEKGEDGRIYPGVNGYSAQAGLDVGYQWQLGHFYVAPMLGLAVGASYNIESIEPFITGNTSVSAPDDKVQLAMGLNLHLLRMGWAF